MIPSRAALLCSIALLGACSKDFAGGAGRDPDAVDPFTGDDTAVDTGPPVDTSPPVVDDGPLFDGSHVLGLLLSIDEAGLASLAAAPTTPVAATLRVDGSEPLSVAVALSGPSVRDLNGKASFSLSLDGVVPEQTLLGHRSLLLDGTPADCSGMRRSLGAMVMALGGVPTPRVGFASLRVNDQDFGLYNLVEAMDADWLARVGRSGAALYDGQNQVGGDGAVLALDFQTGLDGGFVPLVGDGADRSAISAVTAAVESTWATPDYYGTTGLVVDWHAVHAAWAAEEWLGALDGYFQDRDHYYVVVDPLLGKVSVMPGSLDAAFAADGSTGRDWVSPLGALGAGCLQDGNCAYGQWAAVAGLQEAIDVPTLQSAFDAQAALTRDALLADPRRECAVEAVDPARAALSTWITDRSAAIEARWHL